MPRNPKDLNKRNKKVRRERPAYIKMGLQEIGIWHSVNTLRRQGVPKHIV